MSRRKPKKVKNHHGGHTYLNDEYAALQEHLEAQDDARDYKKRNKKGRDMLKLPPAVLGTLSNVHHGYNTGYQHTTHTHNHPGDTIVWESPLTGKKLYGGNGRGVNEWSGAWGLIIDLAQNITKTIEYGFVRDISTEKFGALRKHTGLVRKIKSDLLSLAWNDMSAPPCTLDFWVTLWDMLPEKTVAMCMGGHGRTGTCLAALMIASGESTYYEAVAHVRDKHCDRAIETVEQEKYLHKLYMEMLKRRIEYWQTDGAGEDGAADQLLTAQDALQYAEDHVPSQQSSYGKKPEPKVVEVQAHAPTKSATILASFKPTPAELALVGPDRYKIVGAVVYKLSCRVINCTRGDKCPDRSHLGWAVWDTDNEIVKH